MLEYQKKILKKLRFNSFLFVKELNKSVNWLSKKEYLSLLSWVEENYEPIEIQS